MANIRRYESDEVPSHLNHCDFGTLIAAYYIQYETRVSFEEFMDDQIRLRGLAEIIHGQCEFRINGDDGGVHNRRKQYSWVLVTKSRDDDNGGGGNGFVERPSDPSSSKTADQVVCM